MPKTDPQFDTLIAAYQKDFATTPLTDETRALLPIIAFTVHGIPSVITKYAKQAQGIVAPVKLFEVVYQLEPVIGIGRVQAALKAIHKKPYPF